MAYYKLKQEHPIFKEVDEIFSLMEKYGISFEATGGDKYAITKRGDSNTYFLLDIEKSQGDFNGGISDLPPNFEWKIIFEKD